MQPVHVLSDLDAADQRLVDAVATIAGTTDVLLLDTWLGCDKTTWEPVSDKREAAVYVESLRRPGRYGLDISIYGRHAIKPNMSAAEFVRQLAARMHRPFLVGDCIPFPYSYFRIDPDGAIYEVITLPDDEDGDHYDLCSDLPPSHPEYHPEARLWPAHQPYPAKPELAPDHMPLDIRGGCDAAHRGKLCESFWAPCPKMRRRAL